MFFVRNPARAAARRPSPEKGGLLGWLFGRPGAYLDEGDAEYEEALGIQAAILAGRMEFVDGVHGQTFIAAGCGEAREGEVHFTFDRAFVGDYDYLPAGKAVLGAHVSLSVALHDCGEHDDVRLVQIVRNLETRDGRVATAEPNSAIRWERSGWADPTAPSRGWRIDELDSGNSPFYVSSRFYGNHGSSTIAARLRDSPGDWFTDRHRGKEFRTCAVSYLPCRALLLASIDWGYTIDGEGRASFYPAWPRANPGAPPELVHAVRRWDAIAGNIPVGL